MSETKYLVDNNAILQIGAHRAASTFFSEHCRVPEEVAHEAGPRRAERLARLTVPMSARILEEVVAVMTTVPVGDKTLVDLYGNKGPADPILVATALVLNNPERPSLFDDEWVVVTNDGACAREGEPVRDQDSDLARVGRAHRFSEIRLTPVSRLPDAHQAKLVQRHRKDAFEGVARAYVRVLAHRDRLLTPDS
ncbi:hypothetical protein G5V59_26175 [Nocardioides sp. W3-2-3]|uniref:hypothetical protein n=1 Tax=Nocardioides convexus TaxID=2712224 RepID=UPI00241831A3|nr:hypothetical protein [Nocardioides convexus]NHA01942.1 hypothetical protein [Nocardioides convexus]